MLSVQTGFQALSLFSKFTKKGGTIDYNAQFAGRKDVKDEISFFREAIKTIRTPQAFVNNPRLMNFAMAAYGIGGQEISKGSLGQIMLSNPDDPASPAGRNKDARIRKLFSDFGFFREGISKFADPAFVEKIVQQYVEGGATQSVGKLNTDVSDALYFRKKAASVNSELDLITDPILLRVTVGALNIPASQLKKMTLPQLTAAIKKGLDISKLKNAEFVDSFIRSGMVRKELDNLRNNRTSLVDFLA